MLFYAFVVFCTGADGHQVQLIYHSSYAEQSSLKVYLKYILTHEKIIIQAVKIPSFQSINCSKSTYMS